jgi:hypothetical protein
MDSVKAAPSSPSVRSVYIRRLTLSNYCRAIEKTPFHHHKCISPYVKRWRERGNTAKLHHVYQVGNV